MRSRSTLRHRRRAGSAIAAGLATALVLAACGNGDDADRTDDETGDEAATGDLGGIDDGTELTMWTRAATEAQAQGLVDAYNETHDNQVNLTVIPTDDYQARVGAAAGSDELPDLFALDVVFVPNFTSAGLYLDITDRIAQLPFADELAPSHVDVGTFDGRQHVVPHILDLSVLFYNRDLYEQAGLDPDQPPATLSEMAEHARAVDALGDDIHGTFFGGNCGGCLVFTWWPSLWADGHEVLNEDGTEAYLDSDAARAVYDIYQGLVDDDIIAPGTRDEAGPTWTGVFPEGNIGVMPMPSTTLGLMPDDLDVGVAPIPGIEGGRSTFVGGDAIGIAHNSDVPDQAWHFLSWTLSEEAQIEVVAAHADVVGRTDLASNPYTEDDPRAVLINEMVGEGETPFSMNFGQTFNDPQGPWIPLFRHAVFEDGEDIEQHNDNINASLQG
jgi:multiple sugar transport system substrate-binding protein